MYSVSPKASWVFRMKSGSRFTMWELTVCFSDRLTHTFTAMEFREAVVKQSSVSFLKMSRGFKKKRYQAKHPCKIRKWQELNNTMHGFCQILNLTFKTRSLRAIPPTVTSLNQGLFAPDILPGGVHDEIIIGYKIIQNISLRFLPQLISVQNLVRENYISFNIVINLLLHITFIVIIINVR